MTSELTIVKLSPRELMYLKNTDFLAEPLVNVVDSAESRDNERHTVRVSPEIAEQFRSAFTERFAKVGFDADYEPTSEGQMLERLIDRFFGR